MDKKIVYIIIAALITLNQSCTNKNGEKQKQLISEVDSVSLRDSIEDTDTLYLSIYKKELENGQYRDFYITRGEDGYIFRAYDSASKQYHRIDFNADDYMNGGVPGITGFASPDGRYVYVVGDILANSTGWICTLLIYQIDTKTLNAKLVNGAAAWRLEEDGFTVASETRCTTPDAQCSAEMDFAFVDITYGFDGKIKHKSKEYPSKEIELRYGKNQNKVNGLGVIRHSFYD